MDKTIKILMYAGILLFINSCHGEDCWKLKYKPIIPGPPVKIKCIKCEE